LLGGKRTTLGCRALKCGPHQECCVFAGFSRESKKHKLHDGLKVMEGVPAEAVFRVVKASAKPFNSS
jgi:hypothetical protein